MLIAVNVVEMLKWLAAAVPVVAWRNMYVCAISMECTHNQICDKLFDYSVAGGIGNLYARMRHFLSL